MSAVRQEATVPAFPLGRPVDGRERYGMTPEQAHVYRYLVKNRPHKGCFDIKYRDVAVVMVCRHSNVFQRIDGLVERGWLEKVGSRFMFVPPVKVFRAVRG
jgi:DNA-binding MarR family transcriptional regulator